MAGTETTRRGRHLNEKAEMTDLQLNRLRATLELRTQEADDLRAELVKLREERDDARLLLKQSQAAEMRMFDRAEKAEQERDALAATVERLRDVLCRVAAECDGDLEDIVEDEDPADILAARDARVKAEALKNAAEWFQLNYHDETAAAELDRMSDAIKKGGA